MRNDWDSVVGTFAGAAEGFAQVVGGIDEADWDLPGLGTWTVRDLTGHASRALSVIPAYLDKEPAPERVAGPVGYFLAVRTASADAIAERGREAGAALGDDQAGAVADLARRVVSLVNDSAPDAAVTPAVGTMTLIDYLPTRTFELAVHSLDLVRATHCAVPESLDLAVRASCELAGRLAAALPTAQDLLLAMTGRTGPPERLSVV